MSLTGGVRHRFRAGSGGGESFRSKVGSTLLVQLAGLVLGVAQGAIIARWLGPEGKGVLAIALLVPGLLGMILNPGLTPTFTYLTASGKATVGDLVSHALVFAAIAGVVAFVLVGAGLGLGIVQRLLPGIPPGVLLLALAGLPVTMFGGQLAAILLGRERIHRMNLIALVGTAAALAFVALALVVLRSGASGVVIAAICSAVLTGVLYWRALALTRAEVRPRWDTALLRPMFSYGIRAHAGNLAQFFNYRLDNFILNFIAGPAAVGIYSVSVRLAELVWLLPGAVGTVIFPRAAGRTAEHMNRFTPRVFWWTLGATSVAGIAIALVGRFAIRLVYSAAFLGAYRPLLLLLPGTMLLGGAKVLTNELAGRGRPEYNAIAAAAALALTVVLDLALIPSHGAVGAAIASSVAYGAVSVLAIAFWVIVRKRSRAPFHEHELRVQGSAGVAGDTVMPGE